MDPIMRLEQFGFSCPSGLDDGAQARAALFLKQMAAQYEQTKDVLWCVLDSPVLPNGTKLEPADAFHAVVSEVHGLLVQASQLHKMLGQQLFEQRQVGEALTQQVQQLKKNDVSETARHDLQRQLEQIKAAYKQEADGLRSEIEKLRQQLQQQAQLNVQLEKRALLQRAESPTEQPGQDQNLSRRLIYQRDLLEQQIKQLQIQKQEQDAQQLAYQQLLEVAKSELHQRGIEQHVVQQIAQTTGALAKACAEYDQARQESEQVKAELKKLRGLYETEKLSWQNEKLDMKLQWQQMYEQLCQQLNLQQQ